MGDKALLDWREGLLARQTRVECRLAERTLPWHDAKNSSLGNKAVIMRCLPQTEIRALKRRQPWSAFPFIAKMSSGAYARSCIPQRMRSLPLAQGKRGAASSALAVLLLAQGEDGGWRAGRASTFEETGYALFALHVKDGSEADGTQAHRADGRASAGCPTNH